MIRLGPNTELYGSFTKSPGGFGGALFGWLFNQYGIDAVYKPFRIDDINLAVDAMRVLDIKGAGVSSPFKTQIMGGCIDKVDLKAREIGSANTLVNVNGVVESINTDYLAAYEVIKEYVDPKYRDRIVILGRGGYAKSVRYASSLVGLGFWYITREYWHELAALENYIVFNCTPVEGKEIEKILPKSNLFIDSGTSSVTGQKLALIQGCAQFNLYMKNREIEVRYEEIEEEFYKYYRN